MAGWDHEFDVDARDVELLRDCLRVLRRTCARHRIEFGFYRDRSLPSEDRERYGLTYDLQSSDAPLMVAEFIVEMRAISTIQKGRRRRQLPLRLMQSVAWTNTPDPVIDQLSPDLVPEDVRTDAATILERYQAAFSAYGRGELDAADFLDSQHSLITDLALLLGSGATDRDSFPQLLVKLIVDPDLRSRAAQIGTWRNKVKHRRQRSLAPQVVDAGADIVWVVAERVTGAYVDPVSVAARLVEADPAAAFRLPPMFLRSGADRRPHR